MDTKDSASADPDRTTDAPVDGHSRRNFLGGFGVMGVMAMAGMVDAPHARASSPQHIATAPELSAIGKVDVIRDEKHEVPGGTEHIVQYVVSDDKGTNVRHSYNLSRVRQSGSYTMAANFRVEHFALGQPLTEKPIDTKTLQISVYGLEGEVSGNRRKDTITTTIVADDGTVHRQTQVVPVRLDLSEFENLDTASLVAKMGNIHFGKGNLK